MINDKALISRAEQGDIEALRILAENDNTAKFLLGGIYCGYPENEYLKNFPKLAEYFNPSEGFKLLDKFLYINITDPGQRYAIYSGTYDIYHTETRKAYDPSRGDCFFKGEQRTDALGKKMEFAKKALDSVEELKNNRLIPDDIANELIEVRKKMLEAAKKEFDSL